MGGEVHIYFMRDPSRLEIKTGCVAFAFFCEDLAACSTIVHISVGPGKSIVYNAGIKELCGKSILLADDKHYGGSCDTESRSG